MRFSLGRVFFSSVSITHHSIRWRCTKSRTGPPISMLPYMHGCFIFAKTWLPDSHQIDSDLIYHGKKNTKKTDTPPRNIYFPKYVPLNRNNIYIYDVTYCRTPLSYIHHLNHPSQGAYNTYMFICAMVQSRV